MGEQLLVPGISLASSDPVVDAMLRGALAESTLIRYVTPTRKWLIYCADRGIDPADAPDIALCRWLDHYATSDSQRGSHRSARTVLMAVAALRCVQKILSQESGKPVVPYQRSARPGLNNWLAAYLRNTGLERRRADALRASGLAAMVEHHAAHLHPRRGVDFAHARYLSHRNIALLLIGWWGAFRRSEVTAIRREHCSLTREGLRIYVPRSKTDQSGEGDYVPLVRRPDLRYCPVSAYEAYIGQYGHRLGEWLFELSPSGLNKHIHDWARICGVPGNITTHSLRAGFVTEALAQKVPEHMVARHARMRSIGTMRLYNRDADPFGPQNPTGQVRLQNLTPYPQPAGMLPEKGETDVQHDHSHGDNQ